MSSTSIVHSDPTKNDQPITTDNPLPVGSAQIGDWDVNLNDNEIDTPLHFLSGLDTSSDLAITWDASNNPVTLVRTIGTDTYTRTITWDANDNPTFISRWVKS